MLDISRISNQPTIWEFPYQNDTEFKLSYKYLVLFFLFIACLNIFVIELSKYTGNFDPGPAKDYIVYAEEIIQQGYPNPTNWLPGFGYYIAFKYFITDLLNIPYHSSKYFIDLITISLSAVFSFYICYLLIRNTVISLISSIALVCSPIFILGVSECLPLIIFQPFFLLSLIIFLREIQKSNHINLSQIFVSGIIMGLASLIRGNVNYIIIVLGLFLLIKRKLFIKYTWKKLLSIIIVFYFGQSLIMAPWNLYVKKINKDSPSYGALYSNYFEGLRRHPGNRVSDWVIDYRKKDIPGNNNKEFVIEGSLNSVLKFNIYWIKKDPVALVNLYILKFIRVWYLSDSGKWDWFIFYLHFPIWIIAILGLLVWFRESRNNPSLFFILLIIGYMWAIGGIMDGIARYTAPLYGFINIFSGIFIVNLFNYFQKRILKSP
tara:strand:- start:442 stop:1740 length:1299 start_codon:yes stop_codon:yes gene_type:complete